MSERYGLWDTESGNSLGFYKSQEAALAVVQQELHTYGVDSVASLALDRADEIGEGKLIAEGNALVDLVRKWTIEQSLVAVENSATK